MREDNKGQRRSFGGPRRNNDSRGGGGRFGRRDNRGPRRDFSGPREMHKATCSECGTECEVPFKPTEGRSVFCNECFAKNKPKRY